MPCVNLSVTLTRTGTVVGSCSFDVVLLRDNVAITTVTVVAAANGPYTFLYKDTAAVASHIYSAVVQPNSCGCTPGSVGSVSWSVGGGSCVSPVLASTGFSPIENQCGTTMSASLPVGASIAGPGVGAWANVSAVNVTVSDPGVMTISGGGGLSPSVAATFAAPGTDTATYTGISNQGCSPCVVVKRYVVSGRACSVTWSLSRTSFVANVDAPITYSATGIPAGCSFTLRPYIGTTPLTIGGFWPSVVLTSASPSFSTSNTWGPEYAGVNVNWKPDPSQAACMTCSISPSQVNLDITAGVPALPIGWTLTPGTISSGGGTVPVTIAATGIPAGCLVNFELTNQAGTIFGLVPLTDVAPSFTFGQPPGVPGTITVVPSPYQSSCLAGAVFTPASRIITVT